MGSGVHKGALGPGLSGFSSVYGPEAPSTESSYTLLNTNLQNDYP